MTFEPKSVTHPGWKALLKCGTYGEAAVVEVAYELRVNGAAELSHFSVSRSDEDSLNCFHHDIMEQGVLCTRGQSVTNARQGGEIKNVSMKEKALFHITYFMVLYISSVSLSVRVFFRVPR